MTRSGTRSRLLPAAAAVLVVASACGGSPDVAAAPDSPALGPGLVLRVEHVGGFVMPQVLAARLPLVSVYGDGRVITQGPQVALHPGPALPNLLVRDVGPDGAARLVERALDAGVGEAGELGQPPVADATSTRFTVITDDGTQQTDAYALLETLPGDVEGGSMAVQGLPEEQLAARAELSDLLTALTDLPSALGEEAVGEEEPYEPAAVAVVVSPWADPGDGLEQQPEVAWPGPELPGEPLVPQLDLTCVTVRGDDLQPVLAAAREANAGTPWTSAGSRWSLTFRPLLPDEEGCADLREAS